MLKSFIKFYKPYKKLFFLDLLVATIASVCELIYPMLTRTLINETIPNRNIRTIGVFAVVLITLYLIKAACAYFMQYWGHVVGVRMQADMRKELFNHLERLPNKYFDNTKTGEIMSRMINDLMEISELAHHGPENIFISAIMFIGSFIILAGINIKLTLIIFTVLPVIVIFTLYQRKKMKKAFMQTRIETAEVNSTLENSIAGIRTSKAFLGQKYEEEKFEKGNVRFKEAREKAYKVMAEYSSGVNFGLDLLDYVVLIIGGLFTYYDLINLGDFLAYVLYIKLFKQPIKTIVDFMEQYQNGMTGFKRYLTIMEEEEEKEGNENLREVKGKITFDNIHFSYEDNKVLNGLSLNIEAGKMLALVGPSGGGKSTLCNLIPRFYDVDGGDILIDNKSIYDLSLESLRSNIGIVQQEVFLFTGTIKENIKYGKQDATDDEIIEAAKRANIHKFIISLPDGYDTFIGERGVKLSGGQKQRLSIARVFLKNPPILILDEATSALDNVTEFLIQKSLEELCKGRTTIVVAHRLSTIKNANEIIVLTDKGIEERGNHEELLRKDGIYAELNKYAEKHKSIS